MRKTRFLAAGLAALLTAAVLVSAALACGHHSRQAAGRTGSCQVCTVAGCTVAGRHVHNGVTYCGYAHENGFCDGSCHALCTVAGCTETGRHVHNGVTYCGYAHENGFCDGSCLHAAVSAPVNGHHGGHHGHR